MRDLHQEREGTGLPALLIGLGAFEKGMAMVTFAVDHALDQQIAVEMTR